MNTPAITTITRHAIFDELSAKGFAWYGRLDETAFLNRIIDLSSLPSTDSRSTYNNAEKDIWQHCINNPGDWHDNNWVYHYTPLQLLTCDDELFLKFLVEMTHPLVQKDAAKVAWLLEVFNRHLAADGLVIVEEGRISGKPLFKARRLIPRVFISYSWDDDLHKAWVRKFAERLRDDGVESILDQWETVPGDELPHFMETAVRENEFVLIICTPKYKDRSDKRVGGVGYEGDIMTGEVLETRNRRKFIPVLRRGDGPQSIPSWLKGCLYIDLRHDPYAESQYRDLSDTLHGTRDKAPPVRPRTIPKHAAATSSVSSHKPTPVPDGPIKIIGIIEKEVGKPRNDGTRGSALYLVPLRLSRMPSREWADVFVETWRHPPESTGKHRPSIASVQGDKILLDGTTVEEVAEVHRKTLLLVVEKTNRIIDEYETKKRIEEERRREAERQHDESVRDAAKNISFE